MCALICILYVILYIGTPEYIAPEVRPHTLALLMYTYMLYYTIILYTSMYILFYIHVIHTKPYIVYYTNILYSILTYILIYVYIPHHIY